MRKFIKQKKEKMKEFIKKIMKELIKQIIEKMKQSIKQIRIVMKIPVYLQGVKLPSFSIKEIFYFIREVITRYFKYHIGNMRSLFLKSELRKWLVEKYEFFYNLKGIRDFFEKIRFKEKVRIFIEKSLIFLFYLNLFALIIAVIGIFYFKCRYYIMVEFYIFFF